MLDGLSKKFSNTTKKTQKVSPNFSLSANAQLDGLSYKNSYEEKEIYSQKKSLKLNIDFNWQKIVSVILVTILVGVITVYASNSIGFVKNKIDLVKMFQSGKYLIVLQNNAEVRATGGFIGSFALADVEFGKIKNLDFETNIFKRDHKYDYALKRQAPEPLASWLKSEDYLYWSMRDANWAIDYSESAKEIAWFYKNEGGEDVDGVIAINATCIQELIKMIGPINLPKYNQVITSDNFFPVLHEEIEKKYFEKEENIAENEPKTILRDLFGEITIRLKDKKYQQKLADFVFKQLGSKEILLYFNNQDLENIILGKNWGGEVRKTSKDYIYINNSNLGGLKSSLNIAQSVKLDSIINNTNGEVINKLTIIRSHLGDGSWPDGDNKNYMRILVPDGSELVSAQMDKNNISAKINLGKEAEKTVFGLWYTTPVGQTKILTIQYKLPLKLSNVKDYQLYLQKQPGSLDDEVEVIANDKVLYRGDLAQDKEIK